MVGLKLYSLDEKLDLIEEEAYKQNNEYLIELVESAKNEPTTYQKMLDRIDYTEIGNYDESFKTFENEINCLLAVGLIDKEEYNELHFKLENYFLDWKVKKNKI